MLECPNFSAERTPYQIGHLVAWKHKLLVFSLGLSTVVVLDLNTYKYSQLHKAKLRYQINTIPPVFISENIANQECLLPEEKKVAQKKRKETRTKRPKTR